jgi:hypothetical protein
MAAPESLPKIDEVNQMSTPRTKPAILHRLQTERKRLEVALELVPPARMEEPGVVAVSSVKDILTHLADWEAHMPDWVEHARQGEIIDSPEPGVTWKEFNQVIYARHQFQPLDDALQYFHATHQRFMAMVETMPEEEMLTPGYYQLTGEKAIWDWLKGYANHDLWAKTHIRKWLRQECT